jgi:uncharacterized protein (DUF362 family)
MGATASGGCGGITRRGFLLGSGFGAVAGAGLTGSAVLAWQRWLRDSAAKADPDALRSFTGTTREIKNPSCAMPGPFPGRVIEVRHADSVSDRNEIRRAPVHAMMNRGMMELTGAGHPHEAWRRFFEPGDVVGIKVNPVGYQRRSGVVGSISSPEVLLEIVENLKAAGVKARDMIVFERYANEFREAGYERVMRERTLDGVRWYASGSNYDPGQLSIDGYDAKIEKRDRDRHVVGYDPDVFVHMGFAESAYQQDERCHRSHLSVIVTRMVNKLITIPVLKDHRSAGVTLALKNLSHGMNNNVARSHLGTVYRQSGARSGPNQCNTFIPAAAGQAPLREKAVLHILDGLVGVYEGGPGAWNPTWGTWRRRSLFFATDPVAMDHVGWDIIDAKRIEQGWPAVAQMGTLQQGDVVRLSTRLAALASQGPLHSAMLASQVPFVPGNQEWEGFDRRQPEHIILAGTIGLGVFDAGQIEHRVIKLG